MVRCRVQYSKVQCSAVPGSHEAMRSICSAFTIELSSLICTLNFFTVASLYGTNPPFGSLKIFTFFLPPFDGDTRLISPGSPEDFIVVEGVSSSTSKERAWMLEVSCSITGEDLGSRSGDSSQLWSLKGNWSLKCETNTRYHTHTTRELTDVARVREGGREGGRGRGKEGEEERKKRMRKNRRHLLH